MKRIFWVCGLAVVLIFWGCGSSQEPAPGGQSSPQQGLSKKPAESASQQNLVQQKQKYEQEMAQKLAAFKQKMAELKQRAEASSAETKSKADHELQNLQKESANVEVNLDKLRKSAADDWSHMKLDLDQGFERMQKGYDDAVDSLK
jgi:hypothetical protein